MDRKRKNYSLLSERHLRRIIVNNTASDLLHFSNSEHFELRDELLQSDASEDLELLENEFVNRNDELVDNLNESDMVDNIESIMKRKKCIEMIVAIVVKVIQVQMN